jgi:hypothetical protein
MGITAMVANRATTRNGVMIDIVSAIGHADRRVIRGR